jgi:hypothetical protein
LTVAIKNLSQVPPRRKVQRQATPKAYTRTLTPEQVATLKEFSDEAEQIWITAQDAQSVVRAVCHFLANCPPKDGDPQSEDIVGALSPTKGMELLAQSFIRDVQARIDRFDHVQMEFRQFLDSATLTVEKTRA